MKEEKIEKKNKERNKSEKKKWMQEGRRWA